MQQESQIPVTKLFGELYENFYQLGLKDRQGHELLLNHCQKIISGPFEKASEYTGPLISKMISYGSQVLQENPDFYGLVSQYAKGLGKTKEDIIFAFLVPDLFSMMSKWMPGLPYYSFGCSSLFTWCEQRNTLVHGRILDFPFMGSFDTHERALLSSYGDGPKIFSLGSSGIPFPSITAMSEHGFTLALHQKFAPLFNKHGKPIMQIAFDLLQQCQTKEDVLSYLETVQSLASWGMHMGFQNGEVLSVDLLGDHFVYSEQKVTPGQVIYFNNRLLEASDDDDHTIPFGFTQYCQQRQSAFEEKLKQQKLGEKKITAESLMKFMGTPLKFKKKDHWLFDFVTMSTLQNCCLIPQTHECLKLPGSAPKLYNNSHIHIQDCFHKCEQALVTGRQTKVNHNLHKCYHHLSMAQAHFDLKKSHLSHHHMQLALHYAKDHPIYDFCHFFYCALLYMSERHHKNLSRLLIDFKRLKESKNLAPYLKDHCHLFIARLEKIRSGKSSVSIEEIIHPSMQRIFEFEQKMPQALFHHSTKILMNIRIDLMDILYPHVKAS